MSSETEQHHVDAVGKCVDDLIEAADATSLFYPLCEYSSPEDETKH